MRIETQFFGELEISENQIIKFEQGLPGFEERHNFVMLNNYDTAEPVPFMWLQSIEDQSLAFVVTIPFFMKPDYEFELPVDIAESIGLNSPEQAGIYSICKIEGHVDAMTFNLNSPIIINADNKKAVQLVLSNSPYAVSEIFSK